MKREYVRLPQEFVGQALDLSRHAGCDELPMLEQLFALLWGLA